MRIKTYVCFFHYNYYYHSHRMEAYENIDSLV